MVSGGHFIKQYWNYYLELERQFIDTRRYVDFHTKNYSTYSIEYVKLLQAVCSEIDVLGKVIAQLSNKDFKISFDTNLKKWGYEFQKAFPNLDQKCVIFDEMYEIRPFAKWKYVEKKDKNGNIYLALANGCETPFWWSAYNSVKHSRTSMDETKNIQNYQKANLKNMIYSMGALFLMEKFVMREYYGMMQEADEEFMPRKSKLFIIRL